MLSPDQKGIDRRRPRSSAAALKLGCGLIDPSLTVNGTTSSSTSRTNSSGSSANGHLCKATLSSYDAIPRGGTGRDSCDMFTKRARSMHLPAYCTPENHRCDFIPVRDVPPHAGRAAPGPLSKNNQRLGVNSANDFDLCRRRRIVWGRHRVHVAAGDRRLRRWMADAHGSGAPRLPVVGDALNAFNSAGDFRTSREFVIAARTSTHYAP